MLDENIWAKLTEAEKIAELQKHLDILESIDAGKHELSFTQAQGKLTSLRKASEETVFKIIELENAT